MDKAAVIRSVVGADGRHDAFQCNTGWTQESLQNIGGRPSLGAVVAKLQGAVDPAVPPFVGLASRTSHVPWSDPGQTGFSRPGLRPVQARRPGHGEHEAAHDAPGSSPTAASCSPASTSCAGTGTRPGP